MTDGEVNQLVMRYGTTWYVDADHIPVHRVSGGENVPMSTGAALVRVMEENIEEARTARDGIRERYVRAKQDGLFDPDAMETVRNKKLRKRWIQAISTQQADKDRCIAELKHWRSYLTWAQQEAAPMLPAVADQRLPPEKDDDGLEGIPF
jgi:cephalosporin hydroxylase